jgi:7-cyano-7-deazaguanine synthase in queuosine biosynthesis
MDDGDTAILAMSGGMDSFVLATPLAEKKKKLIGVILDYGQDNFAMTFAMVINQAEYLSKRFECEVTVKDVKAFEWQRMENMAENLTPETVYDPERSLEIKQKTFVSGRNSLIALALMSLADVSGVSECWISVQLDEPEWLAVGSYLVGGPKDCTPMWIDRMNLLGEVAFGSLVRLRAPFLDLYWDKKDIVMFGDLYGLPWDMTYSCRYCPPCTKCQQCIIREKAMSPDPADWCNI